MTKATPIQPSAWNAGPKPAVNRRPKPNSRPCKVGIERTQDTARRLRNLIIELADRGDTIDAICRATGAPRWKVEDYTAGLDPRQVRSRSLARNIAIARGVTAIGIQQLKQQRLPSEVWKQLRLMLDYRDDGGRMLSLGAIGETLNQDWRAIHRMMEQRGYDRGVREDRR